MSVEIPYDLIKEVQRSIRKNAGLSAYNPEDPALRTLPSLEESLREIDPSPMNLRCQHCKGRLLRGADSIICVFCGRQANADRRRDSIKFMETHGCRWFLEHLGLDGSGVVTVPVEEEGGSDSSKKVQVELPVSDLLDFEIQWPPEPEESRAGGGDLSPFGNVQVQPPAPGVSSEEYKNGGSGSGWEANFQVQLHDPSFQDDGSTPFHPGEDEVSKTALDDANDRRTSGNSQIDSSFVFHGEADEEDVLDCSCDQGTRGSLPASMDAHAFLQHASVSLSELNTAVGGEKIGEDEADKSSAREKIDGGADLLVSPARRDEEGERGEDEGGSRNAVRSKIDGEVDLLMSQMHDLSFMLANNLSLPQDQER